MSELFYNTICKITAHNVVHDWYAPFRSPYENQSIGSGFFINNEGYILTCSHVVEDAIKLEITIPESKKKYSAEIVCISPDYDIALLKTEYKNDENFLMLADSDNVKQGDKVNAVGYPLGQENLKLTGGVISGSQEHLFQTDAPINPGNSGGPLVNDKNEVIAINSQKISANTADNIGYSVPINYYKLLKENFMSSKSKIVYKPVLLCDFSKIDNFIIDYNNLKGEGYMISKINENSCLYKAGIRQYDILTKINNYEIDNFGEVKVEWSFEKINIKHLLFRFKVGEKIKIEYFSNENKELKTVDVELEYPNYEIDTVYLNLNRDKIDYEIVSGLVICNFKANHIDRNQLIGADLGSKIMHKLLDFSKAENRFGNKLMLVNVLPGSYTYSNNDIKSGLFLEKVNDNDITSLDEFRELISDIKTNNIKHVKLTFDNSKIVILDFNNIKDEHLKLSNDYKYNDSILMKDLFGLYDIKYSTLGKNKIAQVFNVRT